MSTRIYAVFMNGETEAQALIRAAHKSQALSHYTRRNLVIGVASQDEIIAATKDGIEVEDAKDAEASAAEVRG
jgi:hypothetical protein